MELKMIPAGNFVMGSVGSGQNYDEAPVHRVTISEPFLMGATEVTNAQFEQFNPDHKLLRGKRDFSHKDDEAAVFVSWYDAVSFTKWLSQKEGKPYRLPTEAEWEYACRAGTTTPFNTGDSLTPEYYLNQKDERNPKPVDLTVGKTTPNKWGLINMHGLVEEWCLDWYGPYQEGKQTDPVGYSKGDFKVT
ncbi:MAG TPA: glycoside hydrolase, partial [Bacteroidales bacterium]|nr:glycoside hydrolase [Bacteroidales bacterium]